MSRSELFIVTLTGSALLLAHWVIFGEFLAPPKGGLGADYEYFLPALLNGYYWFQVNGLRAVPWFTPAICGGVPLFPNPESLFYSTPQLLTFVIDPLTAVRLTFFGFAAVGFAGTYVLLRRSFRTSIAAALLGAGLFLFNGYYAYRMLVGHLGFHAFMLAPWMAHFAVRDLPRSGPPFFWQLAIDALGIGACVAYMVNSGDHNLPAAVIATTALGLLRVVRGGWLGGCAARLLAGMGVAILLAAAKLAGGFAFLANFPRSAYSYYGAPDLLSLARLLWHALFVGPNSGTRTLLAQGRGFWLTQHEFEYGLTIVPVVVLVVFAIVRLAQFAWQRRLRRPPSLRRSLEYLALVLVLAVPLAVNYYTPAWHDFLKSVPIIRTVNVLARWFTVYVVVLSVLTALAVDTLRRPVLRAAVVMVALALVVAINARTDRTYYVRHVYATGGYYPGAVLQAYARAAETGAPPPVTTIVRRSQAKPNEAMLAGASAIKCYEAIFGYGLEWFPPSQLHPGPALAEEDGRLNVQNPACFVFPASNDCRPGDRFTVAEREHAEAFLEYRAMPFRRPLVQTVADVANLLALAGGVALLLGNGVRKLWRS